MNSEITLIIPDLHLRHQQAEKIIKHIGPDKIIFLGDWADDFDNTPEMVKNTAEWFVWSVNQSNRTHIYGNHECHYAFPYYKLRCSGYEQWKDFIISDIVPKETWNKIKWWYFLDDTWLLTHAGLHIGNLPKRISKLYPNKKQFYTEIDKYLRDELIKAFRDIANNQSTWMLSAGRARYGERDVGGITWCDFNHEFKPIKGLHQIFGHSPLSQEPVWYIIRKGGKKEKYPSSMFSPIKFDDTNISCNLCLDVYGNTYYAVWNGISLEIGNYRDL